jgi:hypothetical protein
MDTLSGPYVKFKNYDSRIPVKSYSARGINPVVSISVQGADDKLGQTIHTQLKQQNK